MRLTEGYRSIIEVMWRASDLVECLIFIGLAVMLGRTVFVGVRFFLRYLSARRDPGALTANSTCASQEAQERLVFELSRGVGTLKTIASAAPFLGLAGTCYGILCLFSRNYAVTKYISSGTILLDISSALVAAAAGLIVATSAAISYNILRMCLEKFENSHSSTLLEAVPRSYGFAQTLPLRERFSGLPAFGLIGALVLGPLVPMFALMLRSQISVGLPVHTLRGRTLGVGVSDPDSAPIVISLIADGVNAPSDVYVNAKEIPWSELGTSLRSQLKVRPRWVVYVEGGDNVPWADVTNAIDVARGLHAEVVLLTVAPGIDSKPIPKSKSRKKVPN